MNHTVADVIHKLTWDTSEYVVLTRNEANALAEYVKLDTIEEDQEFTAEMQEVRDLAHTLLHEFGKLPKDIEIVLRHKTVLQAPDPKTVKVKR